MFVLPFSLCTTQSLLDDGVFTYVKTRVHAYESAEPSTKRVDLDVSELGKKRFTTSEKIRYNPFLDIQCDYINYGTKMIVQTICDFIGLRYLNPVFVS